MHLPSLVGAFSLLAPLALAAPPRSSVIEARQEVSLPHDCKFDSTFNSSVSPQCWGEGFDIWTDYYEDVPEGIEKTFEWELKEVTASPDGYERRVLAIEGQIPGPTIRAKWGDTIVVKITNNLENQGTSIHFHGVRQNNTNDQDGTVSITQCPTPGGGGVTTYKWRATQYGTSWYHSHYGLQAWDGVFGPIVIEGPASAKYDEDLEPILLSDWTHKPVESLFEEARTSDGYPMDNGLINGTNFFEGKVNRTEIKLQAGKVHRLRLVNTAMDTHFKVALDGHKLKVIAADFVPIEPFETDILPIGIGQRYDILVNATEASGNFWLYAHVQTGCGQHAPGPHGPDQEQDVRAIVRYNTNNGMTTTDVPEEKPWPAFGQECQDIPMEKLRPIVQLDVPKPDIEHAFEFNQQYDLDKGVFFWDIKGVPYRSPWEHPTLQQIAENMTQFPAAQLVTEIEGANKWVYVMVNTSGSGFHPIHLHGHDFFILAQSESIYDPANPPTLKLDNPPRRDVAMLPQGGGYLVIAFKTDNPGAWLLHCHIGWHVSMGFALTFVEQRNKIKPTADISGQCEAWKQYAKHHNITQDPDSGV